MVRVKPGFPGDLGSVRYVTELRGNSSGYSRARISQTDPSAHAEGTGSDPTEGSAVTINM